MDFHDINRSPEQRFHFSLEIEISAHWTTRETGIEFHGDVNVAFALNIKVVAQQRSEHFEAIHSVFATQLCPGGRLPWNFTGRALRVFFFQEISTP